MPPKRNVYTIVGIGSDLETRMKGGENTKYELFEVPGVSSLFLLSQEFRSIFAMQLQRERERKCGPRVVPVLE